MHPLGLDPYENLTATVPRLDSTGTVPGNYRTVPGQYRYSTVTVPQSYWQYRNCTVRTGAFLGHKERCRIAETVEKRDRY